VDGRYPDAWVMRTDTGIEKLRFGHLKKRTEWRAVVVLIDSGAILVLHLVPLWSIPPMMSFFRLDITRVPAGNRVYDPEYADWSESRVSKRLASPHGAHG
jgi:hypothetical protein